MGKTRYKRCPDEIERDRERITQLLIRRTPVREIQRIVNAEAGYDPPLSHPAFHNDMQAIREEWRTRAQENIAAVIQRELDAIDAMEGEAWKAFNRSQQGERPGNPRYLGVILSCYERRAKLLGLDAPGRHILGAGEGSAGGLVINIVRAEPPETDNEEL